MKNRILVTLLIISLTVLLYSSIVPESTAQADTTVSYQLVNLSDGTFSYTINVVIPHSLNEYYKSLDHVSATSIDFAKFVTPYSVKPIADCLRSIYPDDEDFTNQVLTLIHQIPYDAVTPVYYPVETLMRNTGDCDLFSVLAASILKAGGLDVVLLHYTSEEHMNIGVHLNTEPQDARLSICSIKDDGVTYYIAESTSSNWREGWRVGECPEDLQNAPVVIISIDSSNEIAPGQVSASFKRLDPTTLSFSITPFIVTETISISINGQVSPAIANQNVTLYSSLNGASWEILSTVLTSIDGSFKYSWKSQGAGQLDVRASWSGNHQYAGTTSEAKSTLILPFYILALIIIVLIIIIVGAITSALFRKNKKKQLAESSAPNPDASISNPINPNQPTPSSPSE